MQLTGKITIQKELANHPDLSALISVITNGDPLIVGEGASNGVGYVIVSAPGASFTFTKTADGYSVVRTK